MDQKIEEFLKFHLEPNEWSRLLDYLRSHSDLTINSTEVKQVEPYGRQVWINDTLMFGNGFSEPGLLDQIKDTYRDTFTSTRFGFAPDFEIERIE